VGAVVVAVVTTESNPERCWVGGRRAECRQLVRGRSHLFGGRQSAHELLCGCDTAVTEWHGWCVMSDRCWAMGDERRVMDEGEL
jgi:hypothetical protein